MHKIKHFSRIITYVAFLQQFIFIINSIVFVTTNDKEKNYHLILELIKSCNFCKSITFVLNCLYRFFFMFCFSSSIINTHRVLYICTHLQLQVLLLLRKISNLSAGCDQNDPDYQAMIGNRLKFCVQRHIELVRYVENCVEVKDFCGISHETHYFPKVILR